MGKSIHLVLFNLDEQIYALYLSAVRRIVRLVKITLLPKAPEIVLGLINIQGEIIPVVNIRRRFRLPERETNLTDQLIIARTERRVVALVADSVLGVIEYQEEDLIAAEKILPGTEYVEGVVKLKDGIILVHNPDKFLSLDEEKVLEGAMLHKEIVI